MNDLLGRFGKVISMEIVTFNIQEKAERCIFALGKRKKDWRKIESQFTDKVEYLVWYEPIK